MDKFPGPGHYDHITEKRYDNSITIGNGQRSKMNSKN